MDIIIKGVGSGLFLAFLIGPVFFTLIQTSLERGFATGALVAIGVSISDVCCIALAYLGISGLMTNPDTSFYLAYGGGLILLSFGGYYLFIKSRKLLTYGGELHEKRPWRYVAKGFIINGLNPMALLFWLGTVGLATTEWGYHSTAQASVYFGALVTTVFATDLLKAKLSDRLRNLITPRFLRVLNIVLGLALIFFGGRLVYHADRFTLP